ncbi:succinate dehydrogenase, hydrophobic membrane anchor protein [Chiayiivirga flava]|uniref:Succinate dehydrogenase hydrophobic membrane anchor subunit n=1 Tax=Chiayiivirga flava TaxID=659595 RepID=A0A7W8FZ96_9GAMM|nr:succinate dehydrogenase, hydrophobic membrane anchor protein [Chiayiivirga flava]MBB5206964.1 succinate dehydrogenase / fumarate reductase membrane anchor subunit [Chiayiivirga flava]
MNVDAHQGRKRAPEQVGRLRNPLAKARGLGSAKDGVKHFTMQRLTAVALALLMPWFVWLVFSLLGADYLTVRLTLAQPLNAALLIALVSALLYHSKLGLQVVAEDYIHTPWMEVSLQVLNFLVNALAAIVAIVAIGRIVFAA